MKQTALLVCVTFLAIFSVAQNIYFPRENYADSIKFEKDIAALAKQVIDRYQEADSVVFIKNLGYLFLTAGEYTNADDDLNKYAALKQYDTANFPLVEMAAGLYGQTMAENPLNRRSFEQIYRQKLTAAYSKCTDSFHKLDSLEGTPNYVFQRWLKHPAYDKYWQRMTPQNQEFSNINIPVFTISGYWDDDQLGALYYYKQHIRWNRNSNDYLLLGPYDHGGSQGRPAKTLEGYKIDSVANISIYKLVFQWMDYVLKDSSRPAILKDRVNFEVMEKTNGSMCHL